MENSLFYEWILGCPDSNSEKVHPVNDPPAEIRRFVNTHKLHSFFYDKLQGRGELLNGINQDLANTLKEIDYTFQSRWSFLRDLSKELPFPLVVIKGFSNHLSSNGRIPLKKSMDIDLLYENPKYLKQCLLKNNFVEFKGETEHEEADLYRGNLYIDLHKLVPVITYPDDIDQVKHNNDLTQNGFRFMKKLDYQAVVKNSIFVDDNILAPNVTLSVLIACANIFRDYITRIDKLPVFKLVELLEVRMLLDLPEYDESLLKELIEAFDAHHSMDFAGYALELLYNVNPFRRLLSHSMNRFPQVLFWNFHSWFFPDDLKHTLLNDKFSYVIAQLADNDFDLRINKRIAATNDSADLSSRLSALQDIQKSTNHKRLSYTLVATLIMEGLELKLMIHHVSALSAKDIISFEFGCDRKTFFGCTEREIDIGTSTQMDTEEDIRLNEEEGSLEVRLYLPNSQLALIQEDGKLPLNLYIEKYEHRIEYNCLCPVLIRLPS
ncbi:hypothetical protein EHV15_11005 [Paenibacillus oralis]|uniref:Nucleotidyltransferase family protein n=1 Tax=Paenibacillus oralis TaxID=2490856 RepID=A0A3P3TZ46_9BACL|nr:hypothetical protein [Paenibacillus oralis]RRJ63391.1 hypothetical protein EHV15_11005 [Paenibacillus oralis]